MSAAAAGRSAGRTHKIPQDEATRIIIAVHAFLIEIGYRGGTPLVQRHPNSTRRTGTWSAPLCEAAGLARPEECPAAPVAVLSAEEDTEHRSIGIVTEGILRIEEAFPYLSLPEYPRAECVAALQNTIPAHG